MVPTVGNIVHFKIAQNEVRPAIIVRVWGNDCVNLVVFFDGANDGAEVNYEKSFILSTPEGTLSGGYLEGYWIPSVTRGDGVGQWNWPVRE